MSEFGRFLYIFYYNGKTKTTQHALKQAKVFRLIRALKLDTVTIAASWYGRYVENLLYVYYQMKDNQSSSDMGFLDPAFYDNC